MRLKMFSVKLHFFEKFNENNHAFYEGANIQKQNIIL